jgi:hypothetical protein
LAASQNPRAFVEDAKFLSKTPGYFIACILNATSVQNEIRLIGAQFQRSRRLRSNRRTFGTRATNAAIAPNSDCQRAIPSAGGAKLRRRFSSLQSRTTPSNSIAEESKTMASTPYGGGILNLGLTRNRNVFTAVRP